MIKSALRNFHWLATVALLLTLPGLAHRNGLPLRYYWTGIFILWRELALSSILLASFLYAVSSPTEFTRKLKSTGPSIPFPKKGLAAIFLPMGYFFSAFLIVLSYNDIIAAVRFDGRADLTLTRIDAWLLRGHSVIGWAHWVLRYHPGWFRPIEFIYLILFCLIGACITIVGASEGLTTALKLVGSIMTAYYFSLLLFYIIPATGPYLADNASIWPKDSQVYLLEMTSGLHLPQFRQGFRPSWIGADYFLAFPCMHLIQPLILIWFLRKRRALVWILGVYTLVLVPCILLLEEHYIVDLLAALPVAAIAIGMIELPSNEKSWGPGRERLVSKSSPT